MLWLSDELAHAEEWQFWLRTHTGPDSRVMELWKKTVASRLTYIHSENAPSLNDILLAWPRYKDNVDLVPHLSIVAFTVAQ